MRIGQKVVCCQFTLDLNVSHTKNSDRWKVKPQTGRIVYIHPRRRYIVVVFHNEIRESFFPCDVVSWGKE